MATDKRTIKSYDEYALKWAEKIRSGKEWGKLYEIMEQLGFIENYLKK